MRVQDMMFGSVVNYISFEGELIPTKLDEQDLSWLATDEKGFNLVHKRIIPDEETLLKIGFKKGHNWFTIRLDKSKVQLEFKPGNGYAILNGKWYEIQFLDELQMLFKVLERTDLDLNFLIE